MIIEDCNLVPFYINEDSLLMICLAGMQSPDGPDELKQEERVGKTLFVMSFYMTMGITQQIILNKQQYDNLWKRIKAEHE